MRSFALILAVVLVAGCQSRQAKPVHVSQAGDQQLECAQLAEMQLQNRLEAARLAKLDEGVALGNAIAMTLSRAWFWPAIFGVDMSDAEQIEARALQDRNRRLQEIAARKGCAPEAPQQGTDARLKAT